MIHHDFLSSEFVVLPDGNWVLQSQKQYVIIIEIYDQESQKISPSDVSTKKVFMQPSINKISSSG